MLLRYTSTLFPFVPRFKVEIFKPAYIFFLRNFLLKYHFDLAQKPHSISLCPVQITKTKSIKEPKRIMLLRTICPLRISKEGIADKAFDL